MIKVKQAHSEFVDHLKNDGKSISTVIAYEKDIEQLTDHLGKRGVEYVHEVNSDHLNDFMIKLAEIGLTNKTISRKTNATKTFFRFLEIKQYIQVNVSEKLRHPKIEAKPPRILSKIEYKALRDTAREDARTFAIIEVLLQTGISISELAGIEIGHLNISDTATKGKLHIPKRESREQRVVPLNEASVEAIKQYLESARPNIEGSVHLFITKTGKGMLVRNIRSTIDRVFEKAGVANAKVNDLRHTFVAHHLMRGTSLQVVSKIVGHKRLSTTEKYLEYIELETDIEKNEIGIL